MIMIISKFYFKQQILEGELHLGGVNWGPPRYEGGGGGGGGNGGGVMGGLKWGSMNTSARWNANDWIM